MTRPTIAFFTVCGGGEEYDFLLGSIEHHAAMGLHVVLDTAPPEKAQRFPRLPDSVTWVYEPLYGFGKADFRMRSAVERADLLARGLGTDVIVYVDCDEFFTKEAHEELFPHAMEALLEFKTVYWTRDERAVVDRPAREIGHRRAWPRQGDVGWPRNSAWLKHPGYNGNPEDHPICVAQNGLRTVFIPGYYHHELHYAVGSKGNWVFPGYTEVPPTPWPERIRLWKDKGVLPTEAFR